MRKTIIIIAACIATLLLGYTGYRGYKVWKQNHWLTMAKGFAAKADLRNELLCLQQVIRLNPQNLEACHMMADLTDAIRSPAALTWRQRILDFDPKSFDNRMALATTAINLNDFLVASNTLAGMDENGKKTARYQNTAGVLATGLHQVGEAERHFAEAVRLDPGNFVMQLNLGVIRLHSTNLLDQSEARIELQKISLNATNTAVRSQADRELVLDALHRNDLVTAQTISKNMVLATNVVFNDKLLRLEVLKMAKSPELKTYQMHCQREAATNPAQLAQMAGWLMQNGSPAETLGWLQGLPPATRTNQPSALLIAQCQLQLRDWPGLQAAVKDQNWNELEYVRHALLARSLREQGLAGAATAEWGVAVKYASNQKGSLIELFRLAAGWRWNSEAEQLLWLVVNRYPEEKWAAPVLTQVLMAGGRTRSLMELFDTLSKRTPTDVELKNNLAFTALLLGAQEMNPNALAQQVYAKAPQNPSYASTYAYSLYLQSKYKEALQVMQQLAPKDLESPSVAGYYGLILKANGDNKKASVYLRLAAKAKLLPEEQKLFQQALIN